MKYSLIVGLAFLIDALQDFLAWGFVGGLATMSSVVPVVGTAVGTGLGIVLAFAVDVSLSATLGAGLVYLLISEGMYYPGYLFGGGLLELIPGLDVLPGWTAMAVLCVIKKKGEEGKGVVGAAAKALTAGAVLAEGNIAGTVKTGAQMIDIRPAANNNLPQTYAKAA